MSSKFKIISLKKIIIISLILIIAFLSLTTYFTFWYSYSSHSNNSKLVNIPHNSTVREIANILYEKDVIYNKQMFIFATYLVGWSNKLYAGSYLIENGLTNYEVLKILTNHEQQIVQKIIIREGLTAKQIASLFHSKLNIDSSKFLKLIKDTSFIKNKCQLNVHSLEGFLFPKTYSFFWDPDEQDIVYAMTREFKRFFNDSLQRRMKELKLNLKELLTFASIVEGEARLDEERPVIAGVYYNRLRKKMFLEADPTIQYVLPNGPRRLFYSDYKFVSPYNTYLHAGLPPGPINNPGEKSIMAVLYPAEHDYLYFVASGDGGHIFSASYQQHVRAKSKIRNQQ
jgi:UPF0755 protein